MAEPDNMKAAKGTYDSFITLVKWTVPVVAVITLFVVSLIA